MWGISWLAENRLDSQEGLCSMEWVSKETPPEYEAQEVSRPMFLTERSFISLVSETQHTCQHIANSYCHKTQKLSH